MNSNDKAVKSNIKWKKIKVNVIVVYILCIIVAASMAIPFLWMVSASFKDKTEIFEYPIRWIPEVFRTVNYHTVLNEIPFVTFFLNTLKVSGIITGLQLITCSMAGYAFSKLQFPGRDQLFLGYLGTMMVPWHVIMIPQFMIIQKLGLYDTHWSLILTGAFSAFGVFIMRQNMLSIPNSIMEAAKIDGCGPFKTYITIMLPLSRTGLATLAALTFTGVWNDYMGPLIYLDAESKRTIQLGLATFKREFDSNYGAIMAGTVISLVPVIIMYAMAQKHIVEGTAHSGLKG